MSIDQRTNREQDPLSCLELRHGFGDRGILEGITLSVPPGAVFGLIGNNGAGKSTLIRILLGLLRPESGASRVFGCDSLQLNDAVKQRLAYVPQQPEAFQWMKVAQMLDFIGGFYPTWDAAYVDKMLARLAIPRGAKLSKLSPGERQNVALMPRNPRCWSWTSRRQHWIRRRAASCCGKLPDVPGNPAPRCSFQLTS